MKECKYCRSMYEDSLSACPNCGGNKVVTAEEKAEETKLHQKEVENRERAITAPEIQKKKLLGIVAGVVAVIIFIIAISSYNSNKPLSNGMSKDEGEAVLAKGISYYESGDYESAIECFVQLPTDSEQYEEAQKMLSKSKDSYVSAVVEKANGYVSESQYEVALELLKNAQVLLPENAELQKAYNDINTTYKALIRNNAIKEADEYAKKNDYENAIKTVNSALDKIGQDEELFAKLEVYIGGYKEELFKTAKESYNEKGYEAAINVLQEGKTILGEDEELIDLIRQYNECVPISIETLDCIYTPKTDMDVAKWKHLNEMMGEDYVNYSNLTFVDMKGTYGGANEWTISYKVQQEYKLISGTLVLNGETKAGKRKLLIYGDGKLLYSGMVDDSKRSQKFSVNIEGVEYLDIKIDNAHTKGFNGIPVVAFAISDFYIFKNVMY